MPYSAESLEAVSHSILSSGGVTRSATEPRIEGCNSLGRAPFDMRCALLRMQFRILDPEGTPATGRIESLR